MYGTARGILVYRVQPELRIGIVYGGIMPVTLLAASPLALDWKALFRSPHAIPGAFPEDARTVRTPSHYVCPAGFRLYAPGQSPRIVHERMGEPLSPFGGTRRPFATVESPRSE